MRPAPTLVPLPVVPRPGADERISSWLGRLAQFYSIPVDAFLACCGLGGSSIRELEWRLGAAEGASLASRTGMTVEGLSMLTFEEIVPTARLMIATHSRYVCPRCLAGVHRKASALPWNFRCREHGVRFEDKGGSRLDMLLTSTQLSMLDDRVRIGRMRLIRWARGRDEEVPSVSDLLDLLTSRHRKPSPPSLDEQPILSISARRANHEFLTRPITRQALVVVVPEYDRVAPLLTKPVRPGLYSLALGSLLQNYAVVVGLGRLSADPVGYAALVLSASDRKGEERVREILQVWPLTLRRRIYARLRRLRAARDAGRQASTRVSRSRPQGLQSHKFRLNQSHNYAPGVS